MTPGFGRAVLLDRRVQALAAGALVVVSVNATGDLAGWSIIGDGPSGSGQDRCGPPVLISEYASARTPLAVQGEGLHQRADGTGRWQWSVKGRGHMSLIGHELQLDSLTNTPQSVNLQVSARWRQQRTLVAGTMAAENVKAFLPVAKAFPKRGWGELQKFV